VLSITIGLLSSGCGPSTTPRAVTAGAAATAAADGTGVPPGCHLALRRVSAHGTGGARPQVAASADAFAVTWEETSDHRAIRVETFDAEARPLGPSTEVADLTKSGAEPRVVADGAEFLVLWTAEQGESSVINLRRLDRAGKPIGDVQPIVTAPGARALAAVALPDGYAVAWWNWSGTPHQVAVSFFDRRDQPVGRAVPITRAPSPDPTVDFAPARAGGVVTVAWEEMLSPNGGTAPSAQHVLVGELGGGSLRGRIDLGAGETPELGDGLLVWERPADNGLWWAPVAGSAAAARLTDGHTPAAVVRPAGGTAVCWVRDTPLDDGRTDELWCGELTAGQLRAPARVTVEGRGILTLQAAAAPARLGVVWQAQEEDDTRVAFAAVSCAAGAGAPARR
jgi:hypothetical protein